MIVPAAEICERSLVIAFKSIVSSLYLVKLDNLDGCGHTQTTMNRSALALESLPRLRALRLVPGLVILTVIVILPL
jgi:hypothetical protein